MSDCGRNYNWKKSDDFCGEIRTGLKVRRLRCPFQCFDLKAAFIALLLFPVSMYAVYVHGSKIVYLTRPLWGSPPKPFHEIPHFYHENVSMENLCRLHGWQIRDTPRRVFDAVLFSNEFELLEIRWNELQPYVSEFVLLESNSTFTGRTKQTYFAQNRHDFKKFESKLSYGMIGGRFVKGENPFVEEAYQRMALDGLIKIAGIEDDNLLIMSDVDEIPSGHTINLLRWCDDIPEILHLQLRNYLYSFEFLLDNRSWRASVHRYRSGKTRYAHYRQSDEILSAAGWHCSFCFRHINDFIFKMKAYSHSDRIKFLYYMNPSRIQDVICQGTDLFNMLPEEFTYRELIGKMGAIPHSYSSINLPWYLIQNPDKYKFLLPGNCKREQHGSLADSSFHIGKRRVPLDDWTLP